VEANRLLMPIEHVTAWLQQVARNRIIDLFRRRRPERFGDARDDDDRPLGIRPVGRRERGQAATGETEC
jgi:DNA-directed RNA polymerase specialized sigma24 family protein